MSAPEAGIANAQTAANTADQHAMAAGQSADAANSALKRRTTASIP